MKIKILMIINNININKYINNSINKKYKLILKII